MDSMALVGIDETPEMQWCVVYDTHTGTVVHLHQFLGLPSTSFSPEDVARQALEHTPARHDRKQLSVAHPSGDVPLRRDGHYRVDVRSGKVLFRTIEQRPSHR